MICPFFGKNEDKCDVGCGYISPSDVRKIIQFCSCHPDRCPVYQDLAERHPEQSADVAVEDVWPVASGFPPSVSPPVQAHDAMPERETSPETSSPIATTPADVPLVTAAATGVTPSGLLAFGLTTALFGSYHAGAFPLDSSMLGMGIFYGGLGQIAIGFLEWKRQHLFGATAFTAFGLFWLSLIVMTLFPGTRFGQFPEDAAMAAYLILWGLFTAVLLLGSQKLNRSLRLVLSCLLLFYLLLALGTATGSRPISTLAGWQGLLCAAIALYTGLAQLLNDLYGRTVVPLGEQPNAISRPPRRHPS